MSGNPYALDFNGANQGLAALFQGLKEKRMQEDKSSAAVELMKIFGPRPDVGYRQGSLQGGEMIPNADSLATGNAITDARMGPDYTNPGTALPFNIPAKTGFQQTTRQPTQQEALMGLLGLIKDNRQAVPGFQQFGAVNQMMQGMGDQARKQAARDKFLQNSEAYGVSADQAQAVADNPELFKNIYEAKSLPLEFQGKQNAVKLQEKTLNTPTEKGEYQLFREGLPEGTSGKQAWAAWREYKKPAAKAVPKNKVAITDADGNVTGYADAAPSKIPTPQQAGTLANISTGVSRVKDLKRELFAGGDVEKGSINRRLLATSGRVPFMNAGLPATEGRTFRSDFMGAADAIVRARTGAAMTKEEAANMEAEYLPSFFDGDTTIRAKIRKMDEFLSDANKLTVPYRTAPNTDNLIPAHGGKVLNYDPATGGFK